MIHGKCLRLIPRSEKHLAFLPVPVAGEGSLGTGRESIVSFALETCITWNLCRLCHVLFCLSPWSCMTCKEDLKRNLSGARASKQGLCRELCGGERGNEKELRHWMALGHITTNQHFSTVSSQFVNSLWFQLLLAVQVLHACLQTHGISADDAGVSVQCPSRQKSSEVCMSQTVEAGAIEQR